MPSGIARCISAMAFPGLVFLLWSLLAARTLAFAPTTTTSSCRTQGTFHHDMKVGHPRSCQQTILFASTKVDDPLLSRRWYPCDDDDVVDLEQQSLELMAELLRPFLARSDEDVEPEPVEDNADANQLAYRLAKDRFVDFCGEPEGEARLENFFLKAADTTVGKELVATDRFQKVVDGAVVSLQSLLAYAMTYGLTLNPNSVVRAVAHMKKDAESLEETFACHKAWTPTHSLRLKYACLTDNDADEKVPGLRLLSVLQWKRTPLRAYELLVQLGVWSKHENLTLLRSGLPLRFTAAEEAAAKAVAETSELADDSTDTDTLLEIRRDFRSQKVYTIDSASTKEIDDGLGVEVLDDKRYRYWIHIADADRWADRSSELFAIARRRATSIYLPGRSIPMMPSSVSQQVMSLKAQKDVCALSLGVELNPDGSIVPESIIVTPSTVRVDYRLTYDEADEMLEDGVGYSEEWELGQLYTAAQSRRDFRIGNGSAEDFVPTQIPQYSISTVDDGSGDVSIKVDVQVSHNGGKNQSSTVATSDNCNDELPVSASSLLVTEMMILAGEAMGTWGVAKNSTANPLELPFRGQECPDYRGREREQSIMQDLLDNNVGGGYCHAWYARRFFSPAKVTAEPNPHSGLGLDCYVQWSSPIRRFQDLQVHATVKRFLRRQKVLELFEEGRPIPEELTPDHLGCPLLPSQPSFEIVDTDIDYSDQTNLLKPAQLVMRNSNKFWMLEYVRRLKEEDPQRSFEVLVLGCINPSKKQYAVYVYEFGLEWRYTSPVGIQAGDRFHIRLGNVLPQNGQMTLVRMANGMI